MSAICPLCCRSHRSSLCMQQMVLQDVEAGTGAQTKAEGPQHSGGPTSVQVTCYQPGPTGVCSSQHPRNPVLERVMISDVFVLQVLANGTSGQISTTTDEGADGYSESEDNDEHVHYSQRCSHVALHSCCVQPRSALLHTPEGASHAIVGWQKPVAWSVSRMSVAA
jgi:hypothetical protein